MIVEGAVEREALFVGGQNIWVNWFKTGMFEANRGMLILRFMEMNSIKLV